MILENRHCSHGLIWAYLWVPSVLISKTQSYVLQGKHDHGNHVLFSLSQDVQTPPSHFFKSNTLFKKISFPSFLKNRRFQWKASWKKPVLISSVGLMLIIALWRARDLMKANHSKEGALTATFEGLWQYIYFFHKIPGDALSEDKLNNFSPLHLEQSSEKDAPSQPNLCLFTPRAELKSMIDETSGQPSALPTEPKISDNNLKTEEAKPIPKAENKAGEKNWKKFAKKRGARKKN